MLNSNIVKLAEVLDKLCVEGYNTIDKSDIFDALSSENISWDNDILSSTIKELTDNKFIILKYQDDYALCFAFTELGTEFLNKIKIARQNEENKNKSKKQLKNQTPLPLATTEKADGNKIISALTPTANVKVSGSKLKNFLISFIGGFLGGAIAGAIIVLCVLFI